MMDERDPKAPVFGSPEPTPPPEPVPAPVKRRDTSLVVALVLIGIAFGAFAVALVYAIYQG